MATKRLVVLSVLAIGALAGCSRVQLTKSDARPGEWERDTYECRREATFVGSSTTSAYRCGSNVNVYQPTDACSTIAWRPWMATRKLADPKKGGNVTVVRTALRGRLISIVSAVWLLSSLAVLQLNRGGDRLRGPRISQMPQARGERH